MTQPLKLRFSAVGYLLRAIHTMMVALLPADGKRRSGRAAPGACRSIRVEASVNDIIGKPNRRYYDHRRQPSGAVFIILPGQRLDTALNHIFLCPTGDIFSNRMVWFEDKQISAELVQMRLLSPELWGTLPLAGDPVINAERDGPHLASYS